MTNAEIERFIQSVNAILRTGVQLSADWIDRMHQVVHFYVDGGPVGEPRTLTVTYEALKAMMDDPASMAREIQRVIEESP